MRLYTLLSAALCLAAAPPALGQVVWTPVQTSLPLSVELFETGSTGDALHAWYVRADLSDPDVVFDVSRVFNRTRTVAEHTTQSGAFVAVNGGFFSGTQSLSFVGSSGYSYDSNARETVRDGVPYYPTRGAIALLANGHLDVSWIYDVAGTQGQQTTYPVPSPNAPDAPQPRPTATFPTGGARWPFEAGIGGGPVLVQGGRRHITWAEEVFFGTAIDTTTADARTVAGRTADGRLLLLVAEAPGLTLPQAADLMVSLGAVEALNLDGGPSSALWADGAALLPGSQPVVSALVIRSRRYTDPLVVDSESACCYRETGTWTEAADSLFYGTTRSRLNETGTGTDRATFTVPQHPDGYPLVFCGRVEAWWSPGPDRATNVTFTYRRPTGGDVAIASVDQTDSTAAGRWNLVGYLIGTSGDEIVVTDAATGATTPSYVSVDAVRFLPSACPATESGPRAVIGLTVAPNPTAGAATATFSLAETGDVRVVVLDRLGRQVRDERVRLAAGPQSVRVETSGLAAGLYVVRVEAGAAVGTARLAVVR